MRILFVSPYLPSRHSGAPVRLYGLVKSMSAAHQVSVLSCVTRAESPAPALAELRRLSVDVVTVRNDRLALQGLARRTLQARTLLSARSFRGILHHSSALQSALARLTERTRFDVIQLEHCFMASYAYPGDVPVVLDEHNVEYEIPLRSAAVAGAWPRRAYDRLEYQKLRAEEEEAWRNADACAVTSARDAATVRKAVPAARVGVVPNGVDTQHFTPGAPGDPLTLLFFGTICHYPNTDALLFFMREVLPAIGRMHPGVKLLIVGPAPPPEIQRWAGPDIVVTGAVADVRPYLERATVVIAPLRIGGGTRLKILEAMAMGRPVVSTSLGAEGLDVRDGTDVLLADSPKAFAAHVSRLLADAELAKAIGSAGRRLVEDRYDWVAAARSLQDVYRLARRGHGSIAPAASPVTATTVPH